MRIKLNEEINVKQLAQCLTNSNFTQLVVVLLEGRDVALNPPISTLLAQSGAPSSPQIFYLK